MPLCNRVTPEGAIVAVPERGGWMGNRGGRLHREDRTLGSARWRSKAWIICRLDFRDRRRTVMGQGYTELFFLDEATAYASGHRPCAECRRADFLSFKALWAEVHGQPAGASDIDRVLHAARVAPDRSRVTFPARARDLPVGCLVRHEGSAALVGQGALHPWTPGGYGPASDLPAGPVAVLTPAPVVALLRAGLRPQMALAESGG